MSMPRRQKPINVRFEELRKLQQWTQRFKRMQKKKKQNKTKTKTKT